MSTKRADIFKKVPALTPGKKSKIRTDSTPERDVRFTPNAGLPGLERGPIMTSGLCSVAVPQKTPTTGRVKRIPLVTPLQSKMAPLTPGPQRIPVTPAGGSSNNPITPVFLVGGAQRVLVGTPCLNCNTPLTQAKVLDGVARVSEAGPQRVLVSKTPSQSSSNPLTPGIRTGNSGVGGASRVPVMVLAQSTTQNAAINSGTTQVVGNAGLLRRIPESSALRGMETNATFAEAPNTLQSVNQVAAAKRPGTGSDHAGTKSAKRSKAESARALVGITSTKKMPAAVTAVNPDRMGKALASVTPGEVKRQPLYLRQTLASAAKSNATTPKTPFGTRNRQRERQPQDVKHGAESIDALSEFNNRVQSVPGTVQQVNSPDDQVAELVAKTITFDADPSPDEMPHSLPIRSLYNHSAISELTNHYVPSLEPSNQKTTLTFLKIDENPSLNSSVGFIYADEDSGSQHKSTLSKAQQSKRPRNVGFIGLGQNRRSPLVAVNRIRTLASESIETKPLRRIKTIALHDSENEIDISKAEIYSSDLVYPDSASLGAAYKSSRMSDDTKWFKDGNDGKQDDLDFVPHTSYGCHLKAEMGEICGMLEEHNTNEVDEIAILLQRVKKISVTQQHLSAALDLIKISPSNSDSSLSDEAASLKKLDCSEYQQNSEEDQSPGFDRDEVITACDRHNESVGNGPSTSAGSIDDNSDANPASRYINQAAPPVVSFAGSSVIDNDESAYSPRKYSVCLVHDIKLSDDESSNSAQNFLFNNCCSDDSAGRYPSDYDNNFGNNDFFNGEFSDYDNDDKENCPVGPHCNAVVVRECGREGDELEDDIGGQRPASFSSGVLSAIRGSVSACVGVTPLTAESEFGMDSSGNSVYPANSGGNSIISGVELARGSTHRPHWMSDSVGGAKLSDESMLGSNWTGSSADDVNIICGSTHDARLFGSSVSDGFPSAELRKRLVDNELAPMVIHGSLLWNDKANSQVGVANDVAARDCGVENPMKCETRDKRCVLQDITELIVGSRQPSIEEDVDEDDDDVFECNAPMTVSMDHFVQNSVAVITVASPVVDQSVNPAYSFILQSLNPSTHYHADQSIGASSFRDHSEQECPPVTYSSDMPHRMSGYLKGVCPSVTDLSSDASCLMSVGDRTSSSPILSVDYLTSLNVSDISSADDSLSGEVAGEVVGEAGRFMPSKASMSPNSSSEFTDYEKYEVSKRVNEEQRLCNPVAKCFTQEMINGCNDLEPRVFIPIGQSSSPNSSP